MFFIVILYDLLSSTSPCWMCNLHTTNYLKSIQLLVINNKRCLCIHRPCLHSNYTLIMTTLWGMIQMDDILQTTLSNAFLKETRWRHQMETFSALLALCAGNSPVTGEFPAQRPVTQSFDVFFDLRPNKRLSKQSRGWWFETPSRLSCRHCNEMHQWVNVSACWVVI